MAFHVKIKNIGKLADADVYFDRFTVFAGPNNTGKSFVSKIVYSVIVALRADPIGRYISHLIDTLDTAGLRLFDSANLFDDDMQVESFERRIRELQSFVNDSQLQKSDLTKNTIAAIIKRIDDILESVDEVHDSMFFEDSKGFIETDEYFILANFRRSLEKVKSEISEINPDTIDSKGRSLELEQKFINNFQVSSVSQLGIRRNEPLHIDIDNVGEIKFSDKQFDCKLSANAHSFLRSFSTVTYLESPIYQKLKRVLEFSRSVFSNYRFGQISGVPGYFFDLVDNLKFEFVGEIVFPDLYEKLTSNDVLGGRLTISDDGGISFEENGKKFSLPVTATGIANLGLLALLIERKALDKKSLIFIDEPEAHLHPSWQVFMAKSLFELAKEGVHVVIATHSVDILKWLEVHLKKNPDDKKFVALNQFPVVKEPIFSESEFNDFDKKLSDMKQDLLEPFTKLYIDGI